MDRQRDRQVDDDRNRTELGGQIRYFRGNAWTERWAPLSRTTRPPLGTRIFQRISCFPATIRLIVVERKDLRLSCEEPTHLDDSGQSIASPVSEKPD